MVEKIKGGDVQDKKFSVIVPLYKKGYETLPQFLKHLKEQDYKNYELIFVHNSPDDEGKQYLVSRTSPLLKWKGSVKEIDAGYDPELGTGNHCRAFNLGAKSATGDYLLFLDPDIYLYPGILREYQEAFVKEGADFVYGDYDFEGGGRIEGRIYNEYELKCANYISGAFPIKKEAFKGWNETIKALQDWDMRLSAVDAGAQGYYLGRPCFITPAPQPDGISAYGAERWEEIYGNIRNLHGLPISRTVVTSLGAPFHATNTARMLGADTRVHTNILNFKPHSYDNIYLLGFYPLAWQAHMKLFYQLGNLKGQLAGQKRIIHWIGTDIYQMQHKLSWMAWKNITTFLNDKELGFIHLAEGKHTQEELAELGIKAEVVPLPTVKQYKLLPWPEEFTVGVYINPTQDMYFEEQMYDLAEAMPDIKFKFFGNPNRENVIEDNKEWVGWVDMEQFLPTISCLVRMTLHDGLPMGPIEAMMAGRRVITSIPLKYAEECPIEADGINRTKLIEQIRSIKGQGQTTQDNYAAEYWAKETSAKTFKDRMKKYLV